MAFSPPEYCRLFAQKKAYQGGVTGTPAPPPPSYAHAKPNDPGNFSPLWKRAKLKKNGNRHTREPPSLRSIRRGCTACKSFRLFIDTALSPKKTSLSTEFPVLSFNISGLEDSTCVLQTVFLKQFT